MLKDTMGVWWDINTCPVPDGIAPDSVRWRIEGVMKNFGDEEFTIFCVGNLERINPQVLKELSSSGIILRHVPPFGWATLCDHLREWKTRNPIMPQIMLISGDISWFTGPWFHSSILSLGYTIFRAFPAPRPPGYPSLKEWVWEELLLQGRNQFLSNSQIPPQDEHASFCTLCQIPSQSCDDFFDHLTSPQHKQEFAHALLVFVDENNNMFSVLPLDSYDGWNVFRMTIPWTGGDLSQNLSCLSQKSVLRLNIPPGFKKITGVWWDINTCPVPDSFDPGLVRFRIESALQEYLGPGCPVTIFCIGNLDNISPRVLEQISSSGIHLIHSLNRGTGVSDHLREEWEKRNPPPAKIMLISADESWFIFSLFTCGYTVLRAIPTNSQSFSTCTSTYTWAWESLLLEEKKSCLVDTKDEPASWLDKQCQILRQSCDDFVDKSLLLDIEAEPALCQIPSQSEKSCLVDTDGSKDEPALCTLCQIRSQSCDDFINHLKSTSHSQQLWNMVPVDRYKKPCFFCGICKYPGYNRYNMKIHRSSEEHAQKKANKKRSDRVTKKRRIALVKAIKKRGK